MKRKPKKKRTRCDGCSSSANPGLRRICTLLQTVNIDTQKPDGGEAWFCGECQVRG